MDSLAQFFVDDHRACDQAYAALESAAEAANPSEARQRFEAFEQALRGNLRREEEVLFKAFEAASGMTGGPTVVMRAEHDRMRAVLDQMKEASSDADWQGVLDHGDTLLMLVQQHNAKEEGVLFPMAERLLADRWVDLATQIAALVGADQTQGRP